MFLNSFLLNILFVITYGNKVMLCLSLKVGRYKVAKRCQASLGLFREYLEPTLYGYRLFLQGNPFFFPKNF
jgi:hypothetical protein